MHDQMVVLAAFGSLFCFALAALLNHVKSMRDEADERESAFLYPQPLRARALSVQATGNVIRLEAVRAAHRTRPGLSGRSARRT